MSALRVQTGPTILDLLVIKNVGFFSLRYTFGRKKFGPDGKKKFKESMGGMAPFIVQTNISVGTTFQEDAKIKIYQKVKDI